MPGKSSRPGDWPSAFLLSAGCIVTRVLQEVKDGWGGGGRIGCGEPTWGDGHVGLCKPLSSCVKGQAEVSSLKAQEAGVNINPQTTLGKSMSPAGLQSRLVRGGEVWREE